MHEDILVDDDHLHINIVEKHDEDSMVTPEDELTLLREEVLRLRAIIRELHENEPIPFEAVEEELEYREVVTQTDRASAKSQPEEETPSQQKALSDMIARVIAQSRSEEAAAKQSAVEAIEKEESGSFFSNLMANMLGIGGEREEKAEEKAEETERAEESEKAGEAEKVSETEKAEVAEKAE